MSKSGFRRVMNEFHNSPLIEDLGSQFDADKFAQMLKKSHVDTIDLYIKCHHGMNYYDTKIGTKHPHLDIDMLKEVTDACQTYDIKVYAFYSVGCDEDAVFRHPEWLQLDSGGKEKYPRRAGQPVTWRPVCINTPYVEELVLPQVRELVKGYTIEGLWFDIIGLSGDGCWCPYCKKKMQELKLSISSLEDRLDFIEWSRINFIKKVTGFTREIKPTLKVSFNNQVIIWSLRQVLPFMSEVAIEQPFMWGEGYLAFGLDARYVRTLGVSYTGFAGTYHRSWADYGGLANLDQLRFEFATMLANGASCEVAFPLHPTGRIQEADYELMGKAFAEVKEAQEWCEEVRSLAQIAILAEPQKRLEERPYSLRGATKMLIETHHQFDIIDYEGDFSNYELIILPDNQNLTIREIERLNTYLLKGGALLATNLASYDHGSETFLLKEMGITYRGLAPYSLGYLRLEEKIHQSIQPYDYAVYSRFVDIEPDPDAEILSKRIDPYFERTIEHFSGHVQAPPAKESNSPGIVKKGKVIYIATPLFRTYFANNYTIHRKIVENCIGLLVPEKMVITDASSTVEITLTTQKDRTIVHLVNYHTAKSGGPVGDAEPGLPIGIKPGRTVEVIESIPPIFDITLKVRLGFVPKEAYLAPSKERLDFKKEGNYVKVVVPRLGIHQMVVFERGLY